MPTQAPQTQLQCSVGAGLATMQCVWRTLPDTTDANAINNPVIASCCCSLPSHTTHGTILTLDSLKQLFVTMSHSETLSQPVMHASVGVVSRLLQCCLCCFCLLCSAMLHEVLQRKAPQRAATTLWSLNLRSNGTEAEIK